MRWKEVFGALEKSRVEIDETRDVMGLSVFLDTTIEGNMEEKPIIFSFYTLYHAPIDI